MTSPIKLGGVHHAAYRCRDAKETVDWYQRMLGMTYTTAFAEDHVPSTGEYDPYMHVFLDAGNGNILAFFELPNQPDMGKDPNTPKWVQHLAFRVPNLDALHAAKAHIEAQGIDVLGPTHHGIFKSIYFFDPNGHRVELALFGHEHHYERTPALDGVTYVITGGGGRGTRPVVQRDGDGFALQVAHFVWVEIQGDVLRLHAIDATGVEFDQIELRRGLPP